ncbi:MAG: DEAD/DEAH box helicase family protein, partial [Bacteroidota bacterium]
MERITPEYIARLVNFYSEPERPEWKYVPSANDMRTLQARGSAKIFNLMCEHHIALLADEVGMGKTIQSLAVCAALWNQKPNARILVFAPREVVARNWLNEYENFIRTHYRVGDDVVKSASGNDPVKQAFYCTNLFALADGVRQGWPRFFVAKTTSLSSLMAGDLADDRLTGLHIKRSGTTRITRHDKDANKKVARLIKQCIQEEAGSSKPYFDLLIIDEAHYFRNIKADSIRQQTARILFGDPEDPNDPRLARNVLLLTATPNHSSSDDIVNILNQFQSGWKGDSHDALLKKLCVRRLRKLGKTDDAKIKYNYRLEKESESDFAKDPLSEMFFGIYQHELVRMMRTDEGHHANGSGVNQIMKYLEGVEFIPTERPRNKNENDEDGGTNQGIDITVGTDAELLYDLSKDFQRIFGRRPSHPKYVRIVNDLELRSNREKTLVFVRRIASIYEIARQTLEQQDRLLWSKLQQGPLKDLDYDQLDRKRFTDALKETSVISEEEIEEDVAEATEEERIPESRVLDLFKIKKQDRARRGTPAATFRNSFASSRRGVMAIFFCPGADYREQPYTDLELLRFKTGNDVKASYFNSALKRRVASMQEQDSAGSRDVLSILLPKQEEAGKNTVIDGDLQTFFTIFWEQFRLDPNLEDAYKEEVTATYDAFTTYEKEAFSAFIHKGALLASSAVVDLFRMYLETPGEGVENYRAFTGKVRQHITSLRLYRQVQESILLFRTLYLKEFNITSPEKLLEEEWDNFDNAQPIYPYSRGNSNQKILKSFNTPFFPDVLVATSVLQEGVNLQYFCDSVYHYGMAWTPGDNEQRVGRIDRMFGKIDRRLQKGEKATLDITYPFLKSTIDEEQLRRFIKRKFNEENLIDRGLSTEGKEQARFDDSDNDDWKNFLRKPTEAKIEDPF